MCIRLSCIGLKLSPVTGGLVIETLERAGFLQCEKALVRQGKRFTHDFLPFIRLVLGILILRIVGFEEGTDFYGLSDFLSEKSDGGLIVFR
jgi:hypothetical protein